MRVRPLVLVLFGLVISFTYVAGGYTTSGAASSSIVKIAKAQVAAHEGKVSFPKLPPSPKPAKNKTVFIVSSDQSFEGNIRASAGLARAVKILGWKSVLINGQSSPDTQNAGFQEAANQHAYAIFDVYINTNSIGLGMAAAKAANIPVLSITSGSPTKGPNSVAAEVGSVSYNFAMGELEAYYAIAASNGHVHAVLAKDTLFTTDPPITRGQQVVLNKCGTCSVNAVVPFSAANLVTQLPGLVATAVTTYPNTNYVIVQWDAMVSFAAQGIQSASSKAIVVSTGGNKPNLALIRSGTTQAATVAEPLEYFAFLAVNDLVRIKGGERPLPFNAPQKLLVARNLPPAGTAWTGDTNFVAAFKTLWGR